MLRYFEALKRSRCTVDGRLHEARGFVTAGGGGGEPLPGLRQGQGRVSQ